MLPDRLDQSRRCGVLLAATADFTSATHMFSRCDVLKALGAGILALAEGSETLALTTPLKVQ